MNELNQNEYSRAVSDFREARRKAAMQSVISFFTGRSLDLLSFDEVSKKIQLSGQNKRFMAEIPLDSIIGSVGRYEDFNRKFLPRIDEDVTRWAQVRIAFENKGLPPIDVYKIGDAYFVLDGNHRVSIARQFGAPTIEAYVTDFRTKVNVGPDDDLDDILLKAEYSQFLVDTKLDEVRPNIDFQVTVPGRYQRIYEHISVHRYYLGQEKDRNVLWEDAAASWVDNVYLPLVSTFRQHGVLRDFPGRTETDLYLWLKKHHADLSAELGWKIEEDKAVLNLVRNFSERPRRVFARVRNSFSQRFFPAALEEGPRAGEWREAKHTPRNDQTLFSSILVPLGYSDESWEALEQACLIAKRENAVIRGLFVAPITEDIDYEIAREIRNNFESRCANAGVTGEFVIDFGAPDQKIIERAAWNDLVMLQLAYPPGPGPIARLRSGFRSLVQRCPTPIVAVPKAHEKLDTILLAYDGSPKAEEALFLSAYLAANWNVSLVVLGSTRGVPAQRRTEQRARAYLDSQNIQANYISRSGDPADEILAIADGFDVDMIVMGGYEGRPLRTILFGSVVDQVLREFTRPVLVCR